LYRRAKVQHLFESRVSFCDLAALATYNMAIQVITSSRCSRCHVAGKDILITENQ
jgi:hypothetical protein